MPVITISRQHGARASVVVANLAERTGFRVAYKRDVEDRLRNIVGGFLAKKFASEREPSFLDTIMYNMVLWRGLLCESVTGIAKEGNVIIYGRGASVILRGIPGVIHVLIVGDRKKRIHHIAEKHEVTPLEAEEIIDEIEKRREGFYSHHFGETWPDPGKFDLTLNPLNLGIDRCTEILESLTRIEALSQDFLSKGGKMIEKRYVVVSSENRIALSAGLDHNFFDVALKRDRVIDITFYDVPAETRKMAVDAVANFHKDYRVLQTTGAMPKARRELLT